MKKINLIFISIVLLHMGIASCYAQENESESEFMKNWTPPKDYIIETAIDNMGYWNRLAELGLTPYNQETPIITTYTGNKISSPYLVPLESTDVPVITGATTQSENSIVIDPMNVLQVINSNNSTNWPFSTIFGANITHSTNSGQSWIGTTAGTCGTNMGDPVVCISRNGRYYNNLINSIGEQTVCWSTNQGNTWTPVTSGTTNYLNDKNHLWIDNSPTSPYVNNLYNAWTQFGSPNNKKIEITRSTNGGLNWSPQVNISSAVSSGYLDHGANITTGPNGEVYVFWAIHDTWPSFEIAYGLAKSTDGGATYAPATRFLTSCKGVRDQTAPYMIHGMRTNSFPSSCADISNCANRGTVYMVWANQGVPGINTGSDIDIYLVKSTDQGSNWSPAIKVTNDAVGNGKWAWLPWITCDPSNGNLSVIFYDDRNCTGNQAETWVANSLDGGITWDNFKISDVAFTIAPITGLGGGYMGDYIGITAYAGKVYPCWSDNRSGQQLTYVSPYTIAPNISIAITAGSNPMCPGSSVTFTATSIGAFSPSYQWKVNGANVGSNSPTYTNLSLTNGQIVTCEMTSCGNDAVISNAITMNVNAALVPAVSIAITSGTNPTCSGALVTFTATPTCGGETPTYQWKVDGGNVGTNSPTYTTTSLTNGQIVTCELTSSLTCATPTTATSNPINMNVSSNLVPDVSIAITSGTNPICSGISVTFTATPINGGTTPTYQWKVNGNNVGTNSPTFTTSTLANGQIVTCVLTSSATCASPTTVTSNAINMTVNATPPTPTITQNLSVLTSSASTGNQWYLNGVIIPGASNQSYTCTVNGSYTVVVTLNGCTSATSAAIVMTNVAIYEVNNNLGLSIFPNPNHGEFTISFYSEIKSNYKIEIYSSFGQQVYLKVVNEFKGLYSKQINLSEFGKGVYTIKITNSKFETNKKIIVY